MMHEVYYVGRKKYCHVRQQLPTISSDESGIVIYRYCVINTACMIDAA